MYLIHGHDYNINNNNNNSHQLYSPHRPHEPLPWWWFWWIKIAQDTPTSKQRWIGHNHPSIHQAIHSQCIRFWFHQPILTLQTTQSRKKGMRHSSPLPTTPIPCKTPNTYHQSNLEKVWLLVAFLAEAVPQKGIYIFFITNHGCVGSPGLVFCCDDCFDAIKPVQKSF